MYICIHPYTCHTTAYSPRTGDDHFDSLISAHRRSDSFLACNTNADSSRTGHAHFDSFIFAQRRLEPFFCMLYECIQPTNWRRAYSLIRMFLTYSYLCRGVRSFFFGISHKHEQPTNWRRVFWLIRMFWTFWVLCRGVRSLFRTDPVDECESKEWVTLQRRGWNSQKSACCEIYYRTWLQRWRLRISIQSKHLLWKSSKVSSTVTFCSKCS